MSFVVGFAGKIGSGKTTIAKYAASAFNIRYISFGDYVKRQAFLRGIRMTRKNLQNLGQLLYEEDEIKFCVDVLNYHKWDGRSSIIIDGIRHLKANTALKKLVAPIPYFLVFIDADDALRKKRVDSKDLPVFDSHPTEKAVQQNLILAADYIIDGGDDLSITQLKTIELFEKLISMYR